jgi:hypothetical protein
MRTLDKDKDENSKRALSHSADLTMIGAATLVRIMRFLFLVRR